MKILIVASEYGSGMLPFVASIVNALDKSSLFEVYGVFVYDQNNYYKDKISEQVFNRSIFIKKNNYRLLRFVDKFLPFKIIKSIKYLKNKYSVEKIHYLSIEYSIAIYDKLKNRRDTYYTVHDLIPHENEFTSLKDELFRLYMNFCVKSHINQKFHLTTSSVNQYNYLKSIYIDKNICLTPFPSLVNLKIINGKKEVAELLGLENYILFFGTVDKYKGVDLLYSAYLKSGIDIPLVVVGKGIQYFDTDKDRSVYRINRFIEDDEIASLYRKSSFVVYPYRSITMSGVLSLAYFFEKKILVSDLQFFLDNIDENAIVFENKNEKSLIEKLLQIKDKDYNRKSNFYYKNFDENLLAEKYFKFYNTNNTEE